MRAARWLAHELVAEVTYPPFRKAQAIEAAVSGAIDNARRGFAGISHVTRGGRFGARQQIRTSVGGEVFHGVSDKRDALVVLRTGYDDLRRDLLAAAPTGHIADSIRDSLANFDLFFDRESDSVLIRWATEWPTYQAWWARLRELREECRAAGIPLSSADPPPLPSTVWQRGADGTGSRLDAALSLARGSAYTVMGLMGMWGLFAALRSLRDLKAIGID